MYIFCDRRSHSVHEPFKPESNKITVKCYCSTLHVYQAKMPDSCAPRTTWLLLANSTCLCIYLVQGNININRIRFWPYNDTPEWIADPRLP